MNTDTTEISCPSCGTVSHFEELGRDASAFCRVCDFPLFWARTPRGEAMSEGQGEEGLRRLPGTAGRVALATIDCPVCTEPNPIAASICIRCGSELRPSPTVAVRVTMPEPPPPAPAPPPPPKRKIWPWILLAVLAVAAIVVLLILLL